MLNIGADVVYHIYRQIQVASPGNPVSGASKVAAFFAFYLTD